jgi:hypothetical protein
MHKPLGPIPITTKKKKEEASKLKSQFLAINLRLFEDSAINSEKGKVSS